MVPLVELLYSIIWLLWIHLVLIKGQNTATVHAYCDDFGEILHSNDGSTWIQDDAQYIGWTTGLTAVITVSSSTIIRVLCQDDVHTGGFVGQVTYLGQQYYSTNPITSSYWSVSSSATGSTTSLQYQQRSCCSEISTQAWWIWNGQNGDTLTFDFEMSQLISSDSTTSPTSIPTAAQITAQPTKAPTTPDPTRSPTEQPVVPSTTAPPTPKPSAPPSMQPTAAPTKKLAEAAVDDADTTEVPESDDHKSDKSEQPTANNGMPMDNLKVLVIVMVTVFVLLLCICVYVTYKWVWLKEIKAAEDAKNIEQEGKESNAVGKQSNHNANKVEERSAVQGEQKKDGANVQDKHKSDKIAKCVDCGSNQKGKIYQEDGNFYCLECWKQYE